VQLLVRGLHQQTIADRNIKSSLHEAPQRDRHDLLIPVLWLMTVE